MNCWNGRAGRLVLCVVWLWAGRDAAFAQEQRGPLTVALQQGKASESERLAAATLVIFNENDRDSRGLARFYAAQRGIPKEQILGLKCATTEEISREEYDTQILQPIRRAMSANSWWRLREGSEESGEVESSRIRFIALIRGVPLKIAAAVNYPGDTQASPPPVGTRNEASVDSELATLGYPPGPISGARRNPYYRGFTPILDTRTPELFLVARLDGPTPEIVRGMIADAIATEKGGLDGFAYVDARGLPAGDQLSEGDKWLLALAKDARSRGIPVILDNGPGLFPDGYPMRRAAFYFGWYSQTVAGALGEPGFKFQPGAIACHIHSFSAETVRDPRQFWVGPLLSAGAAAALGNVYEPYLTLTPHLDVFFERLRSGFTFAESAYMAQRVVSWQTTIVGDPLYRPFSHDGVLGTRTREWAAYREAARKWSDDRREEGEAELREKGKRLRSGVIFEGLGLLQIAAGAPGDAQQSFQQARKFYATSDDILRVAIHEAMLLRSQGNKTEAENLARSMIAAHSRARGAEVLRMFLPPPPATPTPKASPQ